MPDAFSQAMRTILVVEDSDDDYEALKRALRAVTNFQCTLHRCEDGRSALDYLFRQGIYEDPNTSIRPNLVLLDLNMPGLDGHRVLVEVKEHASLKIIPVIVMTSSDAEQDIESCYQAGANSYILKPTSSSRLCQTVHGLINFWIDFAMLPGTESTLLRDGRHPLGVSSPAPAGIDPSSS